MTTIDVTTETRDDSAALRKKVEEIRTLVAREEKNVALTRYAIGAHVNEVTGGKETYGDNAVGIIAHAVDRDEDSLYDYAAVAAAWEEGSFKKLLAERNARGAPLSFSHFIELTKKRGKGRDGLTLEARTDLLNLVLQESWTVRATGVAVRAALGMSEDVDQRPADLDQIRKASAAWMSRAAKLEAVLEAIEERGITSTEHDAATTTADQLAQVREACSNLEDRLRKLVQDQPIRLPNAPPTEDRPSA